MRFLTPTILIVISVAAFFGFIDPTYKRIQELQEEERLFQEALDNSKELQAVRDNLLSQYNSFAASDLERLEKMVPDHVDNVRLVRNIDGIASQYGMEPRNVKVETSQEGSTAIGSADTGPRHQAVRISFNVRGPYDIFLQFAEDLERNLRLTDITQITFASSDLDLYEYSVNIQTYWLR